MSLIRGQDFPLERDAAPAPRRASGPVRRPRFPRRAAFVLLIAAGILVAVLAAGFAAFTRSIAVYEPRRIDKAQGIVVLTGGSQRLADGLSLLSQGYGQRLLISGVNQRTGREEIARTSGPPSGVLGCCVDLGKGARNTIGNAIEARRWAKANGFDSLLIVTSNYHMPRTIGEFQHVLGGVRLTGYPVVSDSVDVTRIWRDPSMFRVVASEYMKYVLSRLRQTFEHDPETSRLPVLVGRQKPVGPLPIERGETPAPAGGG
jgi:uncharacterized SAM-binding protein YcdF (DUF218 family)